MKKHLVVASIFFIAPYCYSQSNKEPVKVTDMLRIKSINGINISKDGSKAVFTVTAIEPDEYSKGDYDYENQVWMVNTDGNSTPRQLTTKEGASQAEWRPDGKQIAFVRLADGKPQIFLLSLDGGEAVQLTKFKYGAGSPKWSPDGKELLFSSNISLNDLLKDSILNPTHSIPTWPYEKPGFNKNEELKASNIKPDPDGNIDEIRAYLENDVTDKKAKVVDKLN
ncbi:MAG TPA: S9 family peptidase, partial [Chitinophagaceae bacterium]